jgi:hypothetical protein
MNQNGNQDHVAVADAIGEDTQQHEKATTFHDPSNPVLKPAKQLDAGQKKSWKRKLISWSFVLVLIGGSAVALYLLLRVNRVNVKVEADSHRELQNAKTKTDSNSESVLTADAINIARAAAGADNARSTNVNPSPSPNASPTPSPSPAASPRTNYSFTGNSSPVFGQINDAGSNGNANQQQNGNGNQQQEKTGESSPAQMQNHANSTTSIFVDEASAKLTSPARTMTATQLRLESKALASAPKTPPAVLPPFGTMLPVRTLGVIFTLRNNSYARLELTRDLAGTSWSLPKGTILVGRTTGSEYDRAFVNVVGYIDPLDNKLVKMTGDVLGSDGATGIPGKRIGLDRNRLKQTLRKVASSGVQVAGMMAGALTGRGTVVIDGAGYRVLNPISDEARGMIGGDDKKTFVKVEAGQSAYVMVADLPKAIQAVDAPGDDELARSIVSLSDREVMELILFGSPDEIRAALPLMNDEQKRLAIKTLAPENKDK